MTLLGRGGAAAVTHRAVAAGADVPLAATTYYFETKDDIVLAAYEHARQRDLDELRESVPQLEAAASSADVAAWLVARYVPRDEDARCAQLVLYELELEAARRPELDELSRTWTDAYGQALAPVLARLGSRDPERDAWLVTVALEGISLEALSSDRADVVRARQGVERLLDALTAPA